MVTASIICTLALVVILLVLDNVRLRMAGDDDQSNNPGVRGVETGDYSVKGNEAEIVRPTIPEDSGLRQEYDEIMDSQNVDGEA